MDIKKMLDLIRDKDEKGFLLFYGECYQMMYSVAFSILQNKQSCEDVLQKVAQKLYLLNENKFPVKGHYSWLYQVVKNQSLNNTERMSEDIDNIAIRCFDKDIERVVDMDSYYSMISGLNEKQKEIVTLKVIGGLTHREIGEMLGKNSGTVRWIYNVAVHKLRMTLSALTSLVVIYFGTMLGNLIFGGCGSPAPGTAPPTSATPNPSGTPTAPISPPSHNNVWLYVAIVATIVVAIVVTVNIAKRKNKSANSQQKQS